MDSFGLIKRGDGKMKWLGILLICILIVGCSEKEEPIRLPKKEQPIRLPNIHCGEGILKSDFGNNTITTPNGFIFEVIDVQRSPQPTEIKGSYSWNPNSKQLFCFRDKAPYKDIFGDISTRDFIPSVVFKVKRIGKEKQ